MAVRVGMRMALREPISTLTIIGVLTIGIGLTTTAFGIVDGVLFRKLPYKAPDRLVCLTVGGLPLRSAQWPTEALEVLGRIQSFSQVGVLRPRLFNLTASGDPHRMRGAEASADLFKVVGVKPLRGSLSSLGQGRDDVAVISYRLWLRRFGGEDSVLHQVIRIDGRPRRIVAVMPPSFDFYNFSEIWIPLASSSTEAAPSDLVSVFARLNPGSTLRDAQNEMDVASGTLRERALVDEGTPILVRRLEDERETAGLGPMSVFFLVCSIGVFLVVCANLMNMFLARLVHRRREIALRFALGGGRGRLISQLIIENLAVVVLSASLAAAAACWALYAILPVAPTIPAWMDLSPNWRVLLCSAVLVSLVLALAGVIPTFRVSSQNLQGELKEGGSQGSCGIRSSRWQRIFAGVQMTLATILLVGSTFVLRSTGAMREFVLDSPQHDVTEATVSFDGGSNAYRDEFYNNLMQRVTEHPAVQSVASEWGLELDRPLGGMLSSGTGRAIPLGAIEAKAVGDSFFSAMGLRLESGRSFTAEEAKGAPPVAIVNRQLSRMLWPKESALGKRLTWPTLDEELTVVGVLENERALRTRGFSILTSPGPILYFSGPQIGSKITRILVRSNGAEDEVAKFIRESVRDLNPDLPTDVVPATSDTLVKLYLWLGRILGGLGIASTAVALLGVYGLVSFQAKQREQEMGIRSALGADLGQLRRLVLRQTLRIALPGVLAGSLLAAFVSWALSRALFGVAPLSPTVYLAVAGVLLIMNLAAAYYPALRASRSNPVDCLRSA